MLRPAKDLPPQGELLDRFEYDPETGILRWRVNPEKSAAWNGKNAGKVAGSTRHRDGYIAVMIDGRLFAAHRIIWKMVNGLDPVMHLDHVDLDGGNNRLSNLREATISENMANREAQKNNKLGIKGVKKTSSGKYSARIKVGRVEYYLGSFLSIETAVAAYKDAAVKCYGNFARV